MLRLLHDMSAATIREALEALLMYADRIAAALPDDALADCFQYAIDDAREALARDRSACNE
jgi:hypothetical protein